MENLRLLEIHRKKISIKFTIFILISVWFIQSIFLISLYINNNLKLQDSLETKYSGVENILKNKQKYSELISQNNATTKIILEKSLDGVTIYENNTKILGDINLNSIPDKVFFNSKNYKYYQNRSTINGIDYKIIIEEKNINNISNLLLEFVYFVILTLPFGVLLYFIGYWFVGKNFKPIKETINSLETFSGNINHEMKTPLAEIISSLSLTKKTKTNYEQAIDQTLESTQKLNKILDSMLGIINLVDAEYQKEKIDINQVIKNLVKQNITQLKEEKITIKNNIKEKNIYKTLNKQHLELCLGNILKNAIKYSNKNSIINIEYQDNEIIIQDYGVGIEKKNLKNIFDSYFRENYLTHEGYGLGLALVKKICDLNQWTINIISEKNIGTIVKIKID